MSLSNANAKAISENWEVWKNNLGQRNDHDDEE